MTLTSRQIDIVQEDFERVAPIADAAASLFYARLFEIQPGLARLFQGDMRRQGAMLMSMIGNAVRGLRKPEALVPALEQLGRRHYGYGVVDANYDTVGEALLWTLGHALAADFTDERREAWAAAYGFLAGVMRGASRAPAAKVA